jgi:hypothetical protein
VGIAAAMRTCIQLLVLGAILAAVRPTYAIPAFARKYSLPCSACHEAWPKLNNFGQVFRDNCGTQKLHPCPIGCGCQ